MSIIGAGQGYVDSDEKVWNDVRIETGFSSYNESLERSQRISFPSPMVPQRYSIIDIWKRNNSGKIETTSQDFNPDTEPRSAATKILNTLRHPSQDVCLRVVLWWLGDYMDDGMNEGETGSEDLLDVCGLGLKISPRFFHTIDDLFNNWSFWRMPTGGMVQPSLPTSPFEPTYLVIGSQISTIASNYLAHEANSPPVLLIIGWDDKSWDHESLRPADIDDDESYRPHLVTDIATSTIPSRTFFSRTRIYQRVLDQLIGQINAAEIGDKLLLTLATLPMMHLDTLHIQAKTRILRRSIMFGRGQLRVTGGPDLQAQRYSLRRHIEDSERSRKSFSRFATSLDAGDLLSRLEYLRIQELWEDAITEARFREAEARDILQFHASQLSLEESRKSIELSSNQIEESRRGT